MVPHPFRHPFRIQETSCPCPFLPLRFLSGVAARSYRASSHASWATDTLQKQHKMLQLRNNLTRSKREAPLPTRRNVKKSRQPSPRLRPTSQRRSLALPKRLAQTWSPFCRAHVLRGRSARQAYSAEVSYGGREPLRPCWTDPSEGLRACFFEHSLPLAGQSLIWRLFAP